jgi:SAM-dependent methyltransferase
MMGEESLKFQRKEPIIWPKNPPPLSDEQKRFKKDFLLHWHEVLPQKYGLIEKFNHNNAAIINSFPASIAQNAVCKTLEIGAGLGEHLEYEDLSHQDYTTLEIRPDFVDRIRARFPSVKSIVGDIQGRIPELNDQSFDRILAIHVLEHLHHLPLALAEIKRILKPEGYFAVVIPCEGGLAYSLARKISTQRIFEKKYKSSYTPIIKNEHVSEAWEILAELEKLFVFEQMTYWPLKVPATQVNLVISLLCKVRN